MGLALTSAEGATAGGAGTGGAVAALAVSALLAPCHSCRLNLRCLKFG